MENLILVLLLVVGIALLFKAINEYIGNRRDDDDPLK